MVNLNDLVHLKIDRKLRFKDRKREFCTKTNNNRFVPFFWSDYEWDMVDQCNIVTKKYLDNYEPIVIRGLLGWDGLEWGNISELINMRQIVKDSNSVNLHYRYQYLLLFTAIYLDYRRDPYVVEVLMSLQEAIKDYPTERMRCLPRKGLFYSYGCPIFNSEERDNNGFSTLRSFMLSTIYLLIKKYSINPSGFLVSSLEDDYNYSPFLSMDYDKFTNLKGNTCYFSMKMSKGLSDKIANWN